MDKNTDAKDDVRKGSACRTTGREPMIEEVVSYVRNLNEIGLEQALVQLIMYPENRKHIIICIEEWRVALGIRENMSHLPGDDAERGETGSEK